MELLTYGRKLPFLALHVDKIDSWIFNDSFPAL
jgi:hypothetical protein